MLSGRSKFVFAGLFGLLCFCLFEVGLPLSILMFRSDLFSELFLCLRERLASSLLVGACFVSP